MNVSKKNQDKWKYTSAKRHSTSQITEMHCVKRDNSRLIGIADNFEI